MYHHNSMFLLSLSSPSSIETTHIQPHQKDTEKTHTHTSPHTHFPQIRLAPRHHNMPKVDNLPCPHTDERTQPSQAQVWAHELCSSARSVLPVSFLPQHLPAPSLWPGTPRFTRAQNKSTQPLFFPSCHHWCILVRYLQRLSSSPPFPSALSAPALKTMTVWVTLSTGSFLVSHPFASLFRTE